MKNLIFISVLILSLFLSMAVVPGKGLSVNVNKVIAQLKDKNYTVEAGRRFHIGLKKNQSVKYVVTAPVYLSKTAIGIAADENVKKLRIVIFKQLNKESDEVSIFGEDIDSPAYIKEISEKSYHYVVELTLLDSASEDNYSSVNIIVAYAPMPLRTAQDIKDFYYDHTGEVEFYSDPIRARKAGNKKSDTAKVPCINAEYGKTCIR